MADGRNDILVREVGPGDLRAVFELSSHPSVRAASFRTAAISWEEHIRWFESARTDPLGGFYVAESGGSIAGQIRFRLDGVRAIVSISIDPRFRGKGVGAELYRQALACFRARHHTEEVVAKIKKRNQGSVAFFQKLGFNLVATELIAGEEAVIMAANLEHSEVET